LPPLLSKRSREYEYATQIRLLPQELRFLREGATPP
jgi:hypothetical protein